MLIKIGRQEAIHKFPRIPLRHFDSQKDEEFFSYPKVFANYILTLPSKSYKGHIKLLGTELVFLANHLECEHFIFLGDVDISWLKRLGTYAIFQDALQYLVDNNIGKSFNGALQVGIAEMPILIQHLSWLVRTNGILPYVHFIDPGQNIIGNICQYGNLHISTSHKMADKKFKTIIANSAFTNFTGQSCYNKFSKNGAIKGRTLKV